MKKRYKRKAVKAVLLAAGRSSRMWPLAQHKNKCMYEFLGKPLLFYTLMDLRSAGIENFVIVVSPQDTSIQQYFGDGKEFRVRIEYSVQKSPAGTGDALLAAEGYLLDTFLVANATKGMIAAAARELIAKLESSDMALLVQPREELSDYGAIVEEKGILRKIVEKPVKGKEPSKLASAAVYAMHSDFLQFLKKSKGEYSLISAIQSYADSGKKVSVVKSSGAGITLKYPWHMLEVNKLMLSQIGRGMVSRKAKVHKTASITGPVIIDDFAIVEENVVIRGPCYIGRNSIIRNNCLLREYSSIGSDVLIGYNTEVKNSVICDGTKTHMNYIGDSVVDENVRLGAHTITANRRIDRGEVHSIVKGMPVPTGTAELGAIIGRNSRTGINSSLMPGIKIGQNCFIGPATVVFEDVKDGSRVYSHFRNLVRKNIGR